MKKKSKLYFNSDTQAAIVAYQQATTKAERDKLYVTEIAPAFEKLVENLININKFTGLHDTFDNLKNDCINFLFETLMKFDPTRGTNAFSYFNVVAKRWLIIRSKQKVQRLKRSVSLDDRDSLTITEQLMVDDHDIVQSIEENIDKISLAKNVLTMMQEIKLKVRTDNELACVNAIITIFENVNDIDLLNKSAVLLYMRELSGLTPKQLTAAMQSIKRHYKRLKVDQVANLF